MRAAEGLSTRLLEKRLGERPRDKRMGTFRQQRGSQGQEKRHFGADLGPSMNIPGSGTCSGSFTHIPVSLASQTQPCPLSCQEGVGQQRRATGVCSERVPGKSAHLPAHPVTPVWLTSSESPTQQGSEEQKQPPGGPQADRQTRQPRDGRVAARTTQGEDQVGQPTGLGGRGQVG